MEIDILTLLFAAVLFVLNKPLGLQALANLVNAMIERVPGVKSLPWMKP